MISIIIPVLNEVSVIGPALETLLHQPGNYEVIVVDGGSNDATCDIVQNFPVQLVRKLPTMPTGIGSQLNLGASKVQGDILLFLHVDVQLPSRAILMIEAALKDSQYVGGGFLAQYGADSFWLRLSSWRMQIRARLQHIFSGDMAPFVRCEIFWAIGGYPELPIMDDYEFAARLRRAGPLVALRGPVTISARRHLSRGILRSMLETEITKGLYWMGVSPTVLAAFYRGIQPNRPTPSCYRIINPPSTTEDASNQHP
jgi:rSAM/selenodomain-associated transferase 2